METIFASVLQKRFINRGFLLGPITPIYGFGSIVIILTLDCISAYNLSPFMMLICNFVLSTLSITLLELITGYVMEKMFHSKWWDYSGNFLNIKGYICLKYALLWGAMALILIQIVHPIVSTLIVSLPEIMKHLIATSFLIYFVLDTIYSTLSTIMISQTLNNERNALSRKYLVNIINYFKI